MRNELAPVLMQWYVRNDIDELFEVVGVDVASGVIDIQNIDGYLVELTIQAWDALEIECAEAPDWDEVDDDETADVQAASQAKDYQSELAVAA